MRVLLWRLPSVHFIGAALGDLVNLGVHDEQQFKKKNTKYVLLRSTALAVHVTFQAHAPFC